MKDHLAVVLRVSALVTLLALAGCSKTLQEVQFQPLPKAEVGSQNLAPIQPRPVTDLLREADHAFQEANKAQEDGDYEAALRHYTRMLEFLIEADLDPSVFYNLRGEFERILKSGTDHAKLFEERGRIRAWTAEDFSRPPVKGDLEVPFPLPARVLEEIEEIQTAYPKNFQRGLDRSFKYLPYVQQEFAKAGLPQDLVWLAMVESQFYPTAVSRVGATGMWQFMAATGRRYNLRVDSHVDDRKNWEKSTKAAIAYLTDLRDQFNGNWALAVSSYNMGEYGMERAINMNGGETNLWKLIEEPPAANHIQLETKKFYPKLLATILVAKNPERYGFQVNPQLPADTVRIPVEPGYKLAALESASGLPEGTLKELNPDLLKGVTPPGGVHMLAVPNDSGEKVLAALTTLRPDSTVVLARAEEPESQGGKVSTKRGSKTHIVKRGETLGKIAASHGVTVREIMTANRLRSEKKVLAGQKLTIPSSRANDREVVAKSELSSSSASTEKSAGSVHTAAVRSDIPSTYTVRRGDTLFDIAKRFNMPVKDLQQWNNMGRSSGLRIGDELRLRAPDDALVAKAEVDIEQPPAAADAALTPSVEPDSAKASGTVTHVVQAGEFPGKIAEMYGIGLSELLSSNGLTQSSTLRVGDKLIVRNPSKTVASSSVVTAKADSAAAAAPSPEPATTHKVAKGETASTIAAKYGVRTSDLLAENGLTAKSVIKVGDRLKVPAGKKADGIVLAKAQGGHANVDSGVDSVAPAANSGEQRRIEHTVAKGEFPGAIAQQYGVKLRDLMKWNNWSSTPVLQIGSKVVVFVQ